MKEEWEGTRMVGRGHGGNMLGEARPEKGSAKITQGSVVVKAGRWGEK